MFLCITTLVPAYALENGQARTPPMGWNSWNTFHNDINESIFREVADKFVSTGLAKAGYKYICIDNGWYNTPNASSFNTTRFPNGIKPVADYVHNLGLKLGIYTCWDSRYNETRDANAWASWGIDYVKHDSWKQYSTDTAIWIDMRNAILATKRPMVYSVHFQDRAKVIGNPKIMNMWRFTNDLVPYYNRVSLPTNLNWGVTTVDIITDMARVASITGPGCWADADMIMSGLGNQTMDEWKTAFAISCLLPSPLILSVDIRRASQELLDVFLNEDLIAVNQDTLGSKSWKVRDDGLREVWARRMGDSSFAVLLINMDVAASIQIAWNELKIEGGRAHIRDLWRKQPVGMFSNSYSVNVPTHGTAFLKVTPERFMTGVRSNRSQSAILQPEIMVHPGEGFIRVSLLNFPAAQLRVRCVLSTLSGKKITEAHGSKWPGSPATISLKVPSSSTAGMYIVSLIAENAAANCRTEVRQKVFITP